MVGKEKKTIGVVGLLGILIALLLKAVALFLAIATPTLGVWVSSSMAAFLNGPIWAAILVGLLFFPLLPLAWEGFAAWRRSRKAKKVERFLTFFDRVVLRTVFLNFAFLAILLVSRPEAGFTALQARGDWMLEGADAPWVEKVRPYLFRTADGLEWLYVAARENPYAEDNPDEGTLPDSVPDGDTPDGTSQTKVDGGSKQVGTKTADGGPSKDDGGIGGRWGGVGDGGTTGQGGKGKKVAPTPDGIARPSKPPSKRVRVLWPTPDTLHPAVAGMPASSETSIKAVAQYIGARETDELGRIRAAHDWVADRVAYDAPALELPRLPPQGAERIFKNRIGVCSGYAKLLRALGKQLGLNVIYVVGDSRDESGDIAGGGHAWNAVKLDGAWHLIDATWDAGSVGEGRFKKGYTSRYFLAPPEVFGINHHPDRPEWQLRKTPVTRGQFIRQPMLDPRFYINKMKLLAPTRSQITVENEAIIRVANPNGLFMLANYRAINVASGDGTKCAVNQGREVRIACKFSSSGNWRVQLFMNRERYGRYRYSGQIMVNSR